MVARMLTVLPALLLAGCGPAQMPEHLQLYVSLKGTDDSTCTERAPCRSLRRAIDVVPGGAIGIVNVAAGTYEEAPPRPGWPVVPIANVYYHRVVWLVGDCKHPTTARITKNGNTAFSAQDETIMAVRCFKIEAADGVTGAIGIAGRQHSIIDYGDVEFAALPGGADVDVTEFVIAGCIGPVSITGDAKTHVHASFYSKVNLGCRHALPAPRDFSDGFAIAAWHSLIDARAATLAGDGAGASAGPRCYALKSDIFAPTPPESFPGNGPCNDGGGN